MAATLTRPLGGRGGPGLCRGGRTEAPAIARPGTMKRARAQLLRRRIGKEALMGTKDLGARPGAAPRPGHQGNTRHKTVLPELKAPVNPSSPGSPPPRDPAYLTALGVPDTVPSSGEPTGEPVLSIQGQMSRVPTPEAREPRREDLLASATPAGQPGAKLPTSAPRERARRVIFRRFAFTQY